MFRTSALKAAAAAALALVLVGTGVTAAQAANTPAGSTEPFYIFDATTENLVKDGEAIAFDQLVAGYPVGEGFSNYDKMFTGPTRPPASSSSSRPAAASATRRSGSVAR